MQGVADTWLRQVEEDGYAILPGVFAPDQVATWVRELTAVLHASTDEAASVRSQAGSVYAARNVLELWPPTGHVWRQPPLPGALEAILGPGFGLVRTLFFDKPPERTWALPWHKRLTIAVREHRQMGGPFDKPTRKAGVPHVEAPEDLLRAMLTVRIHLDDVTDENGPLRVIPGSHHEGKRLRLGEVAAHTLLVSRGDVLLIRPLVTHCSSSSHPETRRHRRILHLEFAGTPELPDGYAWHTFVPGRPAA